MCGLRSEREGEKTTQMASEFLSNKYLLVPNLSARPVVKLCEAPALGASLMMNLTALLFLSRRVGVHRRSWLGPTKLLDHRLKGN